VENQLNIAVVIITYKRPDGLRKLLDGLMYQDVAGTPIKALNIIVVDNDPAGSAARVVAEFGDSGLIRLVCLHETRQGIPMARNRGMLHAIGTNDYFAFIDDDEFPTPTWIRTLVTVAFDEHSDCVLGPVIPVFPEGTPRWISGSRVFEGWSHPDRSPIGKAASNNVLVRCAFIREHQITFDERMRVTGGSDYRFFRECVAVGMVIHWSSEAKVFEDIPRSRIQWRWMAQRQIRLGNTFAVDARLSRRLPRIARLYAVGVARAVIGFLGLATFAVSSRWGSSAAMHFLRGIGIVSGLHGYRHDEYGTSRLDRERSAT
jgi:glycosyltransferase involved in cell wall biosynthesis